MGLLSRLLIAEFNAFMGMIDPKVANAALKAVHETGDFAPIDHVEKVLLIVTTQYLDYLSKDECAAADHLIRTCEGIRESEEIQRDKEWKQKHWK